MLKVETKLMHTPIIGQVNVLYFWRSQGWKMLVPHHPLKMLI